MHHLAVTIDFHDTIARCDEWFQLEVRTLPVVFLSWLVDNGIQSQSICRLGDDATSAYRAIREEVQQSGLEQDAARCLSRVCGFLGLEVSPSTIDAALVEIFRPTLHSTEPMPAAIEFVHELSSSGLPLGIVSSAAYHPFVEWTLDKFDIRHRFQHVTTSASCGHYKSSPMIYSHAAELLGVPTSRCLHIGDSLRYDVHAATQAGMQTMYVNRHSEEITPPHPTYVTPDLASAIAIVLEESGTAA